MMELKEGMYVRTKWGIAKITEVEVVEEILGREVQPITVYYVDRCFQPIDETKCFKEDILKTSNNIIDLIEVGDYVNGCYVVEVTRLYTGNGNYIRGVDTDTTQSYGWDTGIPESQIKSIVTKEQFESMSYEVKE